MGPGFVLIFWGFVFLVIAAIWLALVVTAIWGWRRKIVWLKWGAGIAAAMYAAGVVAVVGFFAFGVYWYSRPPEVFREAFREYPSREISELKSQQFFFADSGSVRMRFMTSPQEFKRLVPADLTMRSAEEVRRHLGIGSDTDLEWWTFQIDPSWLYALRETERDANRPGKRGFFWELEIFAYDPKSGAAYYIFSGID